MGSVLLAAALAVGSAVPANAASASDEARIRQFLGSNGVSVEVQDSLLQKLDAGEAWDSLDGAAPVSTVVSKTTSTVTTVEHFADGSVSVSTTDVPQRKAKPGTASPNYSVPRSCRYLSGNSYQSNYAYCRIEQDTGLLNASFEADISMFNGGGRINSVYNPVVNVYGGTFTGQTLSIIRAASSGSVYGSARLSFSYLWVAKGQTVMNGTGWVEGRISGGGYTMASN